MSRPRSEYTQVREPKKRGPKPKCKPVTDPAYGFFGKFQRVRMPLTESDVFSRGPEPTNGYPVQR